MDCKTSRHVIDLIRRSVNLPKLINHYTPLRNNKGRCPFHSDRRPSLSVTPEKRLWHCFGCGRGGDVFNFIMEAEGLLFPQAVKKLAFELGIPFYSEAPTNKIKELESINNLERAFKEYERAIFDYLRWQMRCLPWKKSRWEWTSRDYLCEMMIEHNFDWLRDLVKKRKEIFEDMRRY